MDVLKDLKEKKEQDELNRRIVKASLPVRRSFDHKGTFGKVLIIAGSKGMCGAACLCAGAALRSGAGLVRLSVSEELFPIVQTNVIEATVTDRIGIISGMHELREYDAVAIGPGLGRGEEAKDVLRVVLKSFDGPLVIDADGLNLISDDDNMLELLRRREALGNTVITPHPGEGTRLLKGCNLIEDIKKASREEIAEALVKHTGCIVLYKGHDTIIARKLEGFNFCEDDEEDIIVEMVKNTTGNPGMATGGSGDVLTGIIVSLMGQGLNAFDAARAGAYIHGLSGDLAAKEYGEAGLIAGDLVKYIAYAIKTIQE